MVKARDMYGVSWEEDDALDAELQEAIEHLEAARALVRNASDDPDVDRYRRVPMYLEQAEDAVRMARHTEGAHDMQTGMSATAQWAMGLLGVTTREAFRAWMMAAPEGAEVYDQHFGHAEMRGSMWVDEKGSAYSRECMSDNYRLLAVAYFPMRTSLS